MLTANVKNLTTASEAISLHYMARLHHCINPINTPPHGPIFVRIIRPEFVHNFLLRKTRLHCRPLQIKGEVEGGNVRKSLAVISQCIPTMTKYVTVCKLFLYASLLGISGISVRTWYWANHTSPSDIGFHRSKNQKQKSLRHWPTPFYRLST